MDKIEMIIKKKGFANITDLQMVKFEIEMDKKRIHFKEKNITLTPLSNVSMPEYLNQQKRIKDGELHLWNDTKENDSRKGDFFGYVINPKMNDKQGKIYIYKIIEKLPSSYSLPHWNNRERNVLILNHECFYQGPVRELFDVLGYKENYKIQKTMRVSTTNYDKLQTYFERVF